MGNWINRYTEFLIRNRTLILALVVCVTLGCLALLPSLQVNDDFDELALKNDRDFRFFKQFLEKFGHDEILARAFETEDVLSGESLAFIAKLESVLAEVPHVAKALSLASAQDVRSDGERIDIVKLVEKFPETRQERDALERESEQTGRKLYMTGSPPVAACVTKQTFRDALTYLPFTLVLVVGSMFLIFRNYYLTVIPLAAVPVGVIWTRRTTRTACTRRRAGERPFA